MSASATNIVALFEDEAEPQRRSAPCPGRVLAYLGGHKAVVEADGPVLRIARCLTTLTEKDLKRAASQGAQVSLVFEQDDPTLPIVIELGTGAAPATAPPAPKGVNMPTDGAVKQLRVEATEEMVLQCGRASITLRRDGRIIVKGAYVETHATGTNRIKGGQVRIN